MGNHMNGTVRMSVLFYGFGVLAAAVGAWNAGFTGALLVAAILSGPFIYLFHRIEHPVVREHIPSGKWPGDVDEEWHPTMKHAPEANMHHDWVKESRESLDSMAQGFGEPNYESFLSNNFQD